MDFESGQIYQISKHDHKEPGEIMEIIGYDEEEDRVSYVIIEGVHEGDTDKFDPDSDFATDYLTLLTDYPTDTSEPELPIEPIERHLDFYSLLGEHHAQP